MAKFMVSGDELVRQQDDEEDEPMVILEKGVVKGTARKLKQKPMKALEGWDRLTINFQAHHEHAGEAPTSTPMLNGFLRLETQEQPYFRKLVVTVAWQKVDFSWLAGKVGLVVLSNRSKTEQVMVRLSSKGDADLLVPPNLGLPLWMTREEIYLSSSGEAIDVWVYAFPK